MDADGRRLEEHGDLLDATHMGEPMITIEEAVDAETVRRVEALVNNYNLEVMGSDWRPLNLLLRLAGGEVVGGLVGATEWGWLHVEVLAIQEPYRRKGYGSRLLAMAEEEGVRRGCQLSYLATFSFQARPFYEKHGYEAFGTLEEAGPHAKYWMRKWLVRKPGVSSETPGESLIRPACERDIPAIVRLTERWAAEEPTTTGHYPVNTGERLRARVECYFWVAELNGQLVGFAGGQEVDPRGDAWMYQVICPGERCLALDQLYVLPEHRDQGVGGRLVERLLAEARTSGIEHHVVASANRKWERTLRFYERHGFRRWYFRMFSGRSTEERGR